MTNTDTEDAIRTAAQVAELARAGSELVRITVNTEAAARAVPEIHERLARMGVEVPLIGDFHFNGHKLLAAVPEVREGRSRSTASTPATSGAGRSATSSSRR